MSNHLFFYLQIKSKKTIIFFICVKSCHTAGVILLRNHKKTGIMNEVNFINYLLLAFFVAGTFYVTRIVAKEVCDDFQRYMRPFKRLMRRCLLRMVHGVLSFFRTFSINTAA